MWKIPLQLGAIESSNVLDTCTNILWCAQLEHNKRATTKTTHQNQMQQIKRSTLRYSGFKLCELQSTSDMNNILKRSDLECDPKAYATYCCICCARVRKMNNNRWFNVSLSNRVCCTHAFWAFNYFIWKLNTKWIWSERSCRLRIGIRRSGIMVSLALRYKVKTFLEFQIVFEFERIPKCSG